MSDTEDTHRLAVLAFRRRGLVTVAVSFGSFCRGRRTPLFDRLDLDGCERHERTRTAEGRTVT